MGFKFDGDLIIKLASDISFTGDFRIEMPVFTAQGTVAESFLGRDLQTPSCILILSTGSIRISVGGNNKSFANTLPADTPISGMVVSRVGTNYILNYDGMEYTETNVGGVVFNTFSYFQPSLSLPYTGLVSGVMNFYDETNTLIHSYDFDDSSSPLQLNDSVSGNNGTVSGATTGGYVGGAPVTGTLSITTPVNNFIKWMDKGNFTEVPVSGSYTGSPSTIFYKVDGGEAQAFSSIEIDSVVSQFTGTVLIPNGSHDVTFCFSDNEAIETTRTNIRSVFNILAWGQSNMEGDGTNNQAVALDVGAPTPLMIRFQGGGLQTLVDPTSGNSGGSVLPRIASRFANEGMLVCVSNVAGNGTSTTRWLKSANDLYPRTAVSAGILGGYNIAISIIGETDSNDLTDGTRARMNQIINDLKADYGCESYITYVPRSHLDSYDFGTRSYGNVIDNNRYAYFGGYLGFINVGDAGGDGTHLRTDAELTEAGDIIYKAVTEQRGVGYYTSKITMTITGASGTIPTRVMDTDRMIVAFEGDVTWASGVATIKIDAPVGANVEYYAIGATEGGLQRGVTV